MQRDNDPKDPAAEDANAAPLEFEFVSLDSAREALEEPPAGVPLVRRLTSQDWVLKRKPLSEEERRLTRGASQWMMSLPSDLRPIELLRRYPRIANRLAETWSDVAVTEQKLEELVLDRRGGRQGFPPPVAAELLRLREHWVHVHPPARHPLDPL